MNQNNKYAAHGAGDSVHDHSGQKVKTSALAVAVGLTALFSAIELIGGWWANSLALIADAGHMITDSASLLFALIPNWLSRKGADDDHSYGHARIEVLAAFLNGIAMLGVVAWIFKEAIERFANPPPVAGQSVFIIAGIGLCINIAVAWSLSRDRENVNTRAALLHVFGDMLGSVAALLAGALIYFGGAAFAVADPILSVLVCLLVLHATWELFRDSARVLLDGVPEGVRYDDVGLALQSLEGVEEVHDLHVWTMAPGHGAITAHLRLRKDVDWQSTLQTARALMMDKFGIDHVTLQPEYGD